MPDRQVPVLIDGMQCQDVFCSGIARIERLGGGCFRFVLYSEQHVDGRWEWQVVNKLVLPVTALPGAIRQASFALAEDGVLLDRDLAQMLN